MRGRRVVAKRYELLHAVGSGGAGTVYRARDHRTRQAVAVKLLHASLASNSDFADRLRREAAIAKSLTSPRIATVLDLGTDDGTPFIVMEFVEGLTLQQILDEHGPIASREALSIIAQIAEALEAAHAAGVVHRDIKPSNVKVSADGSVKVVDFGIAKTEEVSTVTFAGAFLGTVHYLAPEQALGQSDIRSDIYSLGVVAFQMLTGQVPFQGDGPWAVVKMHLEAVPPRLTQVEPNVPVALEAIVERCLRKEPADRFQSPAELCSALSALPESQMPSGAPLNLTTRQTGRVHGLLPLRFERRGRFGLLAIGGLAVMITVLALGMGTSSRSSAVDRSSSVAGTSIRKTATATRAAPSAIQATKQNKATPTPPTTIRTATVDSSTPPQAQPSGRGAAQLFPTKAPSLASPTRPPTATPTPSFTIHFSSEKETSSARDKSGGLRRATRRS